MHLGRLVLLEVLALQSHLGGVHADHERLAGGRSDSIDDVNYTVYIACGVHMCTVPRIPGRLYIALIHPAKPLDKTSAKVDKM